MSALTVKQLFHALIDLPPMFDSHPTSEAIVQVTFDGEHFYAIKSLADLGDGGVVAQLVEFP